MARREDGWTVWLRFNPSKEQIQPRMKPAGNKKEGEGISFQPDPLPDPLPVKWEKKPYPQGREGPGLAGPDGKERLDGQHRFEMP